MDRVEFSSVTRVKKCLRHRNFRIYMGGNAVSLIGTWMQRIAMGWFAWQLSESEFWVGMIAFADLFPAVVLGPLGGVLADRLDRRKILMACSLIALTQAVILCLLTASGVMTIGLLTLIALINGVVNGFYHPVRLSIMPSLLPREDLPNAIAISSVLFNFARFLGPALAGILIVQVGLTGAFLVNALSYLVFIYALTRLDPGVGIPRRQRGGGERVMTQLREGVQYTLAHPVILPMLCLMGLVALCLRPMLDLMPAFAVNQFGGGAETLALLTSCIGIGAMVAGVTLAGRTSGDLVSAVIWATGALALAVVAFVSTPYLPLAALFAAIAGACMVSSGISMQILMQLCVTDEVRGRVLSLYTIVFFGGPAVGALIMGLLSEWFGLSLPFIGGAIVTVVFVMGLRVKRRDMVVRVDQDPAEAPG